jgi:antitoxin FitA
MAENGKFGYDRLGSVGSWPKSIPASGIGTGINPPREQRRMGQVIVRQLDSSVIETHRRRAKPRGVSLEQELRDVITRVATTDREGLIRRVDDIRAMTPPPPPGTPTRTAEELIREDRDGR